jgi:putative membrane protein
LQEDGTMAWPIIVAWMHYVSIMLMVASLLGEHLLLKPEMDVAQARTLQRLDIVYGASATIVLVTGLLRMFLEKGPAYYNHHIAFHILFGLFVIAALLSIYPTMVFLRWRADTKAGKGQQLAAAQFRKIQMIVRVEMTLLLLAPFFATWMAHGEF